ncbi:MAG: trypsin-like peptidase domain-containing protein [Ilumatobacteraceae bacterium]
MSENHEPVEVDRLTESEQLSGLPSDGHDELVEPNATLDADADADAVPMISTPMPPPPPSSPNVQSRRKLRAVALVFVVVAVGFASGILGTIAANKWDITIGSTKISGSSNAPLVTSEVGSDDPSLGTTVVAQVVNKLADSVVTINSQVNDASGQGEASGTGVVLTADGEILTNAHVVAGSTSVTVRFAGETEPRKATVLASDPGNDMALLKIDATNLKPATFAQPGTIRIGDQVIAIGYALALDGGPSVTSGIISALKRTIITESGALNGLIQTDAAISSGNSGGPLVNLRGEVVGINTAVARSDVNQAANNVGFSISVDEIGPVLEQLRSQASGEVRQEGFLGVGLAARTDGGQGAIITSVQPDSPAGLAGIQQDDIVLSVDGEPIDGQAGLVAAIRDAAPGQTVKIEILRGAKRLTVEATLVARDLG